MIRKLLPALFLPLLLTSTGQAQPTNVEVLGSLAVRCLGEVPGRIDSFQVTPGNRMPYLRPFLTRHWIERGYTVFVGDSALDSPVRAIHELRYDPQAASVSYNGLKRDSVVRKIDLTISHSLVSPEGMLVDESRCFDTASDVVRTADVARLQQDPWEETRGQLPVDRGWRSWAEPAVIGTSLAVVVYLFFSVRS